jgi:hypothetical protein
VVENNLILYNANAYKLYFYSAIVVNYAKAAANLTCSPSSIDLLVIGALWYLGQGLTFDDLEECTGISKEGHRCFLHEFLKFGSTKLFKE